MKTVATVFEATYRDYLAQIGGIDLNSAAHRLGVQVRGKEAIIPLFGRHYRVSKDGISDPSGKAPGFDIRVILCKYLLLCPDMDPKENEWVAFRDLKDSGPLTTYFANDVERAIATHFAGKLGQLQASCSDLGGYPPAVQTAYDLSVQFDALPRIPVILLFNDKDDDQGNFWPATCSLLFERRAESYLDPECLAIIGRLLYTWLKKAASTE
ncbi:MAG: DUF3786 domain-containing protein [Deltaproteobacteria bacterium]|nr:DUF3786 domain-containing protein [Deltaproteobacteria bacterium]